jgi:hypothetical protein
VPAEIAFCFATGNTARMRSLDCGMTLSVTRLRWWPTRY